MQDLFIEMSTQILSSETHTLRLKEWMLKAVKPTLTENTGSVFSESHQALRVSDLDLRILVYKGDGKQLVLLCFQTPDVKAPKLPD